MHLPRYGSSLDPAVEIKGSAGGSCVEEGLEFEWCICAAVQAVAR
jgi:hypothetical protein